MGSGMLVEDGKDFKAEFLVEARGLETVGSQDHLLATSPPRFVLCGVEQFRPETMAARRLLHPYRLDVTAATPGPAFEPCMDGLLVVSEKNRQPLSVIHACLFHAVFVEAVFQKSDVLGRRIRFNNKMGTFQIPVDSLLPHTQGYTRFRQTNCSLLLPLFERCHKMLGVHQPLLAQRRVQSHIGLVEAT